MIVPETRNLTIRVFPEPRGCQVALLRSQFRSDAAQVQKIGTIPYFSPDERGLPTFQSVNERRVVLDRGFDDDSGPMSCDEVAGHACGVPQDIVSQGTTDQGSAAGSFGRQSLITGTLRPAFVCAPLMDSLLPRADAGEKPEDIQAMTCASSELCYPDSRDDRLTS